MTTIELEKQLVRAGFEKCSGGKHAIWLKKIPPVPVPVPRHRWQHSKRDSKGILKAASLEK